MFTYTTGGQFDVIVVGAGLAGIACACSAAENGAKVALVSKGRLCHTGSSFYVRSLPWGMLTAGYGENAATQFAREIVEGSHGCIDEQLVDIMVKESNTAADHLKEMGISLHKIETIPCFGTVERGYRLNDFKNLQECCFAALKDHNVRIFDQTNVIDLMVDEKAGRCYGVIAFIKEDRTPVCLKAKAVVLASGGGVDLFKTAFSLPNDTQGTACGMALRHGACATNMEFIQFIPGVIAPAHGLNFHHATFPFINRFETPEDGVGIDEFIPRNENLEDCLKARAKHGPFSSHDCSKWIDIAMIMSQKDKMHPRGMRIHYDTTIKDRQYIKWKDFLSKFGINLENDDIYIYPHAQAFNGGLRINANCETTIEGLYACGEAAGGPHGANRIGGLAILATQVFGKIAGESAAGYAAAHSQYSETYHMEDDLPKGSKAERTPEETMDQIRLIMQEAAFVIRNEEKLASALEKMQAVAESCNPMLYGNAKAFDVMNAANTALACLKAMKMRRESRGSHYREDYPEKNDGLYAAMQTVTIKDGIPCSSFDEMEC